MESSEVIIKKFSNLQIKQTSHSLEQQHFLVEKTDSFALIAPALSSKPNSPKNPLQNKSDFLGIVLKNKKNSLGGGIKWTSLGSTTLFRSKKRIQSTKFRTEPAILPSSYPSCSSTSSSRTDDLSLARMNDSSSRNILIAGRFGDLSPSSKHPSTCSDSYRFSSKLNSLKPKSLLAGTFSRIVEKKRKSTFACKLGQKEERELITCFSSIL
jgi:hypothetical protein